MEAIRREEGTEGTEGGRKDKVSKDNKFRWGRLLARVYFFLCACVYKDDRLLQRRKKNKTKIIYQSKKEGRKTKPFPFLKVEVINFEVKKKTKNRKRYCCGWSFLELKTDELLVSCFFFTVASI